MNSYCALAFSFVAGGLPTSQPTPKPASAATFEGHTGAVWALAFSPDGKTLASAAYEAKCRVLLWDAGTGKKTAALEGHRDQIMGLAFHPDGKMLASASVDETVILWQVQARKEALTVKEPNEHLVTCVAFSPDGKTIAFGGESFRRRFTSGMLPRRS